MAEKKEKKTGVKKSGKVIIEGDFVDFKANDKCKHLVKGKVYNITKQKAELFLQAGYGEIK